VGRLRKVTPSSRFSEAEIYVNSPILPRRSCRLSGTCVLGGQRGQRVPIEHARGGGVSELPGRDGEQSCAAVRTIPKRNTGRSIGSRLALTQMGLTYDRR
jgi:hypothetical protein